MVDTIYVEDAVATHGRSRKIIARFKDARIVQCRHYGEVFNRRKQNFRLQKTRPALILARKFNRRVLPIPAGYGIDGARGYYFSHMLNCLYDCRYCFLQGMFRSAHYVLFVNYEDFIADIERVCGETSDDVWFFSGYDCDSLALDPVTGFVGDFVPAFAKLKNAWLELRTKSTQIRSLIGMKAHPRVVCAFSLSPQPIVAALEHRTPDLDARIEAMRRLADHGWPLGIRFDPLILIEDFERVYGKFIDTLFSRLDPNTVHSATVGTFRMPSTFAKIITRLYPEEPLYAGRFIEQNGNLGYTASTGSDMVKWTLERLGQYLPPERIFVQAPATGGLDDAAPAKLVID